MFGKEKESKEFFEVFKKQHDEEVKCDSKVLERDLVNPTVLPRPDKKRSQDISQDIIVDNQKKSPLGWIKDTQREKEVKEAQADTKKPRKLFLNEVVIKQETLIFGALGAVFLSLACFFVGYKIGIKDILIPETVQRSVEYSELEGGVKSMPRGKKINTVDLSIKRPSVITNQKAGNIKWTLQIISYSDTKQHIKKARDLAKAIKNMTNYNTFVAKRGKEIVVCTGKFNSKDSSELTKALNAISKLEYEGKKQFASSYPIQVR
ncbi:MAG: hypothetical protein HON76_07690 [Candidatus Scalindua sp.]|jgi:hypothetical protein|nr:hypothetical protein [Candidatus Scalindua sp.]MBT5306213.1 hypothetical protein [Candidatus Scalindua sp.]MBT6048099.1 hypothetical protein [Candidatus Scalindua sp.]MBT6227285.1 hypothetical protein [Candidatus Scalindua sp.]MBT6562393.1 hypothetical protein [Candidatus Scalindua sp.]